MNHKTTSIWVALLCIVLFSCQKKSNLTEREKQIEAEQTAVLLPNEIREQEGIRFILNYDQSNARIALKLYRGIGTNLVPVKLDQEQPFVNYAVLTDSLAENSEYTLQAEINSVTNAGKFEITVIGFTNLNLNKRFTVADLSFSASSAGTAKNIIRMKKGITRYSFYSFL